MADSSDDDDLAVLDILQRIKVPSGKPEHAIKATILMAASYYQGCTMLRGKMPTLQEFLKLADDAFRNVTKPGETPDRVS